MTPDEGIDGELGEPFNVLFNPDVQRHALHRQNGGGNGIWTSNR